MRQFILASSAALTSTAKSSSELAALTKGTLMITSTVTDSSTGKYPAIVDAESLGTLKRVQLVMGMGSDKPAITSLHKNHFSYSKAVSSAATQFSVAITIPAPAFIGDYTVIIAKKGVPFNERNKWTVTHYVKDTSITADALAAVLVEQINNQGSGVTASKATVSTTTTLTITGPADGTDYEVLVTDFLSDSGAVIATPTHGAKAFLDEAHIIDLARQAAANDGFRDTYMDGAAAIYSSYPIDKAKKDLGVSYGVTLFTLRFAEPRDMKTRDEVVHQIVQIAVPYKAASTEGDSVAALTAVFDALSGVPAEEEE